jgi:heme/copper-type cytochrome/quinol oxidase subunit 2
MKYIAITFFAFVVFQFVLILIKGEYEVRGLNKTISRNENPKEFWTAMAILLFVVLFALLFYVFLPL